MSPRVALCVAVVSALLAAATTEAASVAGSVTGAQVQRGPDHDAAPAHPGHPEHRAAADAARAMARAAAEGTRTDTGKGLKMLQPLMDLEEKLFSLPAAELTVFLAGLKRSTGEDGFVRHVVAQLEDLKARAHTEDTPISNADIDRMVLVAEIFTAEMGSPNAVGKVVDMVEMLKSKERAPSLAELEAAVGTLLQGAAAAAAGPGPAGDAETAHRARRGWWIFGNTNTDKAWKADTSKCAWVCRQGWWWESDAYGKPACCAETKDSGSPYDSCQYDSCACDALCGGCCD